MNNFSLICFICCVFANVAFAQNFEKRWEFSDLGEGVGLSNVIVADLDGKLPLEIVFGGGGSTNKSLFITRYGQNKILTFPDKINLSFTFPDFTIADIDQDQDDEIILIDQRGNLNIYDLRNDKISLLYTFQTDFIQPGAISAADLDGNGTIEIVVGQLLGLSSKGFLKVYTLLNDDLKVVTSIPVLDCIQLRLENVDLDSNLEIIHSSSFSTNRSHIWDGVTFEEQWAVNQPLGKFELTDFDGDNNKELITTSNNQIRIFDIESDSLLDEVNLNYQTRAIKSFDLINDKISELIVETGIGQITGYKYDKDSLSLLWTLDQIGPRILNFDLEDVDQDNRLELVWGNGQRLKILDLEAQSTEFESFNLDQVHSIRLFQFDKGEDPKINVLFRQLVDSRRVYFIAEYDIEKTTPNRVKGLQGIDLPGGFQIGRTRDLNNSEFIFFTGRRIQVFDTKDYSLIWEGVVPEDFITSFGLEDLDGDGISDIVTLQQFGDIRIHSFQNGEYKEIFSHKINNSGARNANPELRVEDFDRDGKKELVFLGGNNMYLYNREDFSLKWENEDLGFGFTIFYYSVGDLEGDGEFEIAIKGGFGNIGLLKASTGELIAKKNLDNNGNGDGVAIANIDDSPEKEMVFFDGNKIIIVEGKEFNITAERFIKDQGAIGIIAQDFDKDQYIDILYHTANGVFHIEAADLIITNSLSIDPPKKLKIFPNPAIENLVLTLPDNMVSSQLKVLVFNNNGILVKEQNLFPSGIINLNTKFLTPGTYFVKIINGQSSYFGSFIKQ